MRTISCAFTSSIPEIKTDLVPDDLSFLTDKSTYLSKLGLREPLTGCPESLE